ncbi:MAG: hypothetical protein K6G11_01435, partial [Lachnospiraceae bacterium]|nr:hypothetical protein [Lachnospiraceae bacterium]
TPYKKLTDAYLFDALRDKAGFGRISNNPYGNGGYNTGMNGAYGNTMNGGYGNTMNNGYGNNAGMNNGMNNGYGNTGMNNGMNNGYGNTGMNNGMNNSYGNNTGMNNGMNGGMNNTPDSMNNTTIAQTSVSTGTTETTSVTDTFTIAGADKYTDNSSDFNTQQNTVTGSFSPTADFSKSAETPDTSYYGENNQKPIEKPSTPSYTAPASDGKNPEAGYYGTDGFAQTTDATNANGATTDEGYSKPKPYGEIDD